ncbi:MAG: zf-HC2 domain-containing protein [Blastocatellia bacterium]
MKCEECQQLLEEYIDGELDIKQAAQVSAHAGDCPDCSKLYQEIRQEQDLYAHYQREIEITPALWAGVEARIRQEKPARAPGMTLAGLRERLAAMFATPRFSPALAAALVLLAVGLTVVVMSVMNSRNNNQPIATDRPTQDSPGPTNANKAATKPDEKPAELAGGGKDTAKPEKENKPLIQKQFVAKAQPKQADPAQLVREAEQKYLAAISILSRDVNRRRSQIDPTVLARFDGALADIDRTIKETRRVVREHPDDPVALQYLLSAYAKKVDALRDMALD